MVGEEITAFGQQPVHNNWHLWVCLRSSGTKNQQRWYSCVVRCYLTICQRAPRWNHPDTSRQSLYQQHLNLSKVDLVDLLKAATKDQLFHGLTTWATAHQNRAPQIETKVYVKPTNTGLLLHNHSHVAMRYKRGLLKTMLDRAYRLSACWSYFSVECDRLRRIFFWLKYPLSLIISTIRDSVALKAEDQPPKPAPAESPPVRIVSPAI